MTRISIVTVCFNSVGTIRDTIESVIGQQCSGVEHIIVDGGSSDGTMGIVREYSDHLAAIISEPDEGIYDAMNKGIRVARGAIIGTLNSDDFYPNPHVLSTVATAFSDESIMVCYGDLCYVSAKSKERVVRYWRSNEFKNGYFCSGWCPPHPALFVRRTVYERYGLFDPRIEIAADAELMIRFLERHSVTAAHIPEVLVHMRLGGVTNRSISNIWKQNVEIWKALKAHNLNPSIMRFACGKMILRIHQYLSRP